MFIHPWDAALEPAEWQDWLASTDRFGVLAARPNPGWPHLEAAAEVRLAVTSDYAYIPTYWTRI